VKRLIQKEVLINILLGRLALSHLRLIRFPFRHLLRLAGITVEVFLPACTREKAINNFSLKTEQDSEARSITRGVTKMWLCNCSIFKLQTHHNCCCKEEKDDCRPFHELGVILKACASRQPGNNTIGILRLIAEGAALA
jgi:hypothetical protein